MTSIRRSLVVYFLALEAIVLGAVSLSVYETTQQTLQSKEATNRALQADHAGSLAQEAALFATLFSTGDGHFAQGDGEVCVTAVEMGATCVVRFRLHRGEAERRNIRWPRFQRDDYFTDPRWAVPQRFIATMGMPVDEKGVNQGENLNVACRSALLNMMDLLQERGFSREQAYVICSVAVDLKISNAVDVPNFVVSAFLPEHIFQG